MQSIPIVYNGRKLHVFLAAAIIPDDYFAPHAQLNWDQVSTQPAHLLIPYLVNGRIEQFEVHLYQPAEDSIERSAEEFMKRLMNYANSTTAEISGDSDR